MHGLTLGSGFGVAANGQHVYSADNSLVALPETSIGLTPSSGLSFHLSRLKNGVRACVYHEGHRRQSDLCFKF
jgi:enoyl-CoA hydratase/carnithine racemase